MPRSSSGSTKPFELLAHESPMGSSSRWLILLTGRVRRARRVGRTCSSSASSSALGQDAGAGDGPIGEGIFIRRPSNAGALRDMAVPGTADDELEIVPTSRPATSTTTSRTTPTTGGVDRNSGTPDKVFQPAVVVIGGMFIFCAGRVCNDALAGGDAASGATSPTSAAAIVAEPAPATTPTPSRACGPRSASRSTRAGKIDELARRRSLRRCSGRRRRVERAGGLSLAAPRP